MKKILYFYDFAIDHTNRGCQALTYGGISFLLSIIDHPEDFEWLVPAYCFRKREDEIYNVFIDGQFLEIKRRYYFLPEIIISSLFNKIFKGIKPFTRFSRDLQRLEYVTNISGGDGFSDIYRKKTFFILAWPSILAVFLRKKLIIMPQTIGPFNNLYVRKIAHYILQGANKIYVRDYVYSKNLDMLSLTYIRNNDVSFYMNPKPIDYTITKNSVGINISGLTYYNNYRNLAGKFSNYKELVIRIIESFQAKNLDIYLVPHTYNFNQPEINSDDLQASKDLYMELRDKSRVHIVDKDMIAPEIKYIISQFDFFIGTRMHANFAAIFTKVPAFGLAYSYKFSGSFDLYGLKDNYISVHNLKNEDIPKAIDKLLTSYDNRTQIEYMLYSQV